MFTIKTPFHLQKKEVIRLFYNSKKLIDEKVLQQYYFERLMLATAGELKKLIPGRYHKHYSSLSMIKGLQPEVKLNAQNSRNHVTDFVLYPTKTNAPSLNIEVKWRKEDFETWRYPYYDGTQGEGYVVCLKGENGSPEGDRIQGTSIPVIYLDVEEFKKWFVIHANTIISQALSNKLSISPERASGKKYWVVVINTEAKKHYDDFGRKNHIWAFRNNNSPKNIMKILEGDYIIFVKFAFCHPNRMVYPYYYNPNTNIEKARGQYTLSKDIDWAIESSDIYQIKRGYHLNFGNDDLYKGFETEWDGQPATKEYTQFITFYHNNSTEDMLLYHTDESQGRRLLRKHFPADQAGLSELCSAFRRSYNNRGDAVEISDNAFIEFQQLLHSF